MLAQRTEQRIKMIDRTTWMQKDIPPKPKPASNKILGIGVILAGGVVLAVALIIGLEFPRHVREKVKDDQCILGEEHLKYEEWTEDEFYNRYHRVYYWVITNRHGFLCKGESPQVVPRGPYVYKTTQRKVDVHFNGETLTYALMTSQEFQRDITERECGQHCSESDSITVINSSFLRKITAYENDENFIFSLIPKWMEEVTNRLYKAFHGQTATVYSALGSLTQESINTTALDFELQNFAFGLWIGKNDTDYKRSILFSKNFSDFTQEDMKGLYSVLSNGVYLGVTMEQLTVAQPDDMHVCVEENATSCGLLYFLRKCQTNFQEAYKRNHTSAIQRLLCRSSEQCMAISSGGESLLRAYIDALFYFINNVMYVLTSDEFLSEIHSQVTITKPQRDLALGYQGSYVVGGEFVPGILPHNDRMKELLDSMDRVKVETCLGKRNISTNMQVVGYTSSRLKFHSDDMAGFDDFTPVSPALKACVPCVSSNFQLRFSIPDLRRAVWFTKIGESSHQYVHVTRYQMSPVNFYPGQKDVSDVGLQNVTRYTSHLSWFSTPYFDGFEANVTAVVLPDSDEDHSSMIDVEDVTGKVWRKVIRLQYNVGLEEDRLLALRSLRLNINFFGLPIPVYWVEELSEINPLQVEYYHYKVTRLMRVSCGGLIGITIIAIVVVAIGVLITFVPLGLGRVAPMPHDLELHSH